MNPGKILAVLTTYNMADYSVETLMSLHKHSHPEVQFLIVDDHSDDSEWAKISEAIDRATRDGRQVFEWRKDKNEGLTNSWNIGLQAASRLRLNPCLINNDIIVPDRWDYNLSEALMAHPKAAIVAPLSNQPGHCPPQYLDEHLPVTKAEMNDPTRIAEFNADLRRKHESGKGPRWTTHNYVNGFFMLMRLEAIEDVGQFDPRNKNVGNEDEWCRRARDESPRHWRFVIANDVHVFHWKKVTLKNLKAFKGNIYPRRDGTVLDSSGKVLRDDAPKMDDPLATSTGSFVPETPVDAPTASDPEVQAEVDRQKEEAEAKEKAGKRVSEPPRFE